MTIGEGKIKVDLRISRFQNFSITHFSISVTTFYQFLVAKSYPDFCCKWLEGGGRFKLKYIDSSYF